MRVEHRYLLQIRAYKGTSRMTKIITRIKGGLGNQLFCYAAARRLALFNDAELVIDDVTGFVRDKQYCRRYALDNFHIPVRKARPWERMEPLERYRRGLVKYISTHRDFYKRKYIDQKGINLEYRLLDYQSNGTVYIDGFWQSEMYFQDVEKTIRKDLKIKSPKDAANREMALKIESCNSICLHVRWFDEPGSSLNHNIGYSYYKNAVDYIMSKVNRPHFYIFSDNPEAAINMLSLPESSTSCVLHNQDEEMAYADMWLMAKCKHIVTANSTFSWWGGWLGETESKIIIAPKKSFTGSVTAWGFEGLLPDRWLLI